VSHKVGLDVVEKRKILHCRESNPGSSARSPSPVSYSGSSKLGIRNLFSCKSTTTTFSSIRKGRGVKQKVEQNLAGNESAHLQKMFYMSRVEQSSILLPATSQHGHSWHQAPLGPMAIYLFNVKTFLFVLFFPSFDKKEGLDFFIIGVPLLHLGILYGVSLYIYI
jgi:hypothetical protein